MNGTLLWVLAAALITFGCSEPLTAREKGAAIVRGGGAAVGSTVGHLGAGAASEAPGLGSGALIGDQIQSLEEANRAG